MTEFPTDPDAKIEQPRLWRDNGWTASVIKNDDDDGWAVAMTKDDAAEPALRAIVDDPSLPFGVLHGPAAATQFDRHARVVATGRDTERYTRPNALPRRDDGAAEPGDQAGPAVAMVEDDDHAIGAEATRVADDARGRRDDGSA